MKNWQYGLIIGLFLCLSILFTYSNQMIGKLSKPLNVYEYLLQEQPELYQDLRAKLADAIEDAKQPLESEVVNNLWNLSLRNRQIKWRIYQGNIEYLMSTWKYVNNPQKDWPIGTKKQITRQTWLTAVPQVQDFCQRYQPTNVDIPDNIELSLRLQQYLGLVLNKYSTKTHFVEMWVKSKDLMRPCIDPEINDTSCNLLPVPVPDSSPIIKAIYNNSYFNERKEYYPWSGLGYTYDWGNPEKPHVGPSEFIINSTPEEPVEVEVFSVTATEEYCQK
ncbi:MAG: hypothetical protein F6K62_23600 [Sphaerospermopsis sp. SIO1G2]|nr:hypothetical protein [Sphaerospermopsis sp. SIO1G2]